MEESTISLTQFTTASRRFAQQLLVIGENRIELLAVEVQEERNHLLHAFLQAVIVAAFALLAGITLSAAIVVAMWAYSPLGVLLALTCLHGLVGFCLYRRLARCLCDWRSFSASIDQLRKDRACLGRILA